MAIRNLLLLMLVLIVGGCKASGTPPITEDGVAYVRQDQTVDLQLKATVPQGQTLTWEVGAPEHGILTGTPPNLRYRPNAGFAGIDRFTFKAKAGSLSSNESQVLIQVKDLFPNWRSADLDESKSNYVPVRLDPARFTQRWSRAFPDTQLFNFVTGNGKLFLRQYSNLEEEASLLVINPANGETLRTEPFLPQEMYRFELMFENETLYFRGDRGYDGSLPMFHKYDPESGHKEFSTRNEPAPFNWDPQLLDGTAYTWGLTTTPGSGSSTVTALDMGSGEVQWRTTVDGYGCTQALAVDLKRIYFCTSQALYVLDRATGKRLATLFQEEHLNHWASTALDTDRNYLYVLNFDRITGIDLDTLTPVFSQSIGGSYSELAFNRTHVFWRDESALYGINIDTGQVDKTFTTPYELDYALIATDNLLFASSKTTTFAIDLETQTEVWSADLGGEIGLSAQGGLYIVNPRGGTRLIDVQGDEDRSGLLDWYEQLYGIQNPMADDDSDGIANASEFLQGTHPLLDDTDQDGLSDIEETDTHQTNPLAADSDRDGLADDVELTHGLAPLIPGDAYQDLDADGYWNIAEIQGGSDPVDPMSVPAVWAGNPDFKGNQPPAEYTITATYGKFGIESNGRNRFLSVIRGITRIEANFDFSLVTFQASSECGDQLRVALDDVLQDFKFSQGLQTYTIQVSQGHHTIEWLPGGCDLPYKIYSAQIMKLKPPAANDIAAYGFVGKKLVYIGYYGAPIFQLEMPRLFESISHWGFSVVEMDNGQIVLNDGVGVIALLDADKGFHPFPIYGVKSPVQMATLGDRLFLTNNFRYAPVVALDTTTLKYQLSFMIRSDSVKVGEDHNLYFLDGEVWDIKQYDPETLEHLGTLRSNFAARDIDFDIDADFGLYEIYSENIALDPKHWLCRYSELPFQYGCVGIPYWPSSVDVSHDKHSLVSVREGKPLVYRPDLTYVGRFSIPMHSAIWSKNLDFSRIGLLP